MVLPNELSELLDVIYNNNGFYFRGSVLCACVVCVCVLRAHIFLFILVCPVFLVVSPPFFPIFLTPPQSNRLIRTEYSVLLGLLYDKGVSLRL